MHFSVVCLVDYFSREYPYDCIFFHRNALSSAFSCWEALLGEYEKQAQVLVDCTKTLCFDVSCVKVKMYPW